MDSRSIKWMGFKGSKIVFLTKVVVLRWLSASNGGGGLSEFSDGGGGTHERIDGG
jgi:hypothetical protein